MAASGADDWAGFTDGEDEILEGMAIITGGVAYTISEVTSNTEAVVDPAPSGAVSATSSFTIATPSVRLSFQRYAAEFARRVRSAERRRTEYDYLDHTAAVPTWSIVV